MSRAFAALMPAHHELQEVIAEQLAADRAEVEPLAGQPRLLRIAQSWGRDFALAVDTYLAALEEHDPEAATNIQDHLALQLRSALLNRQMDESGVVK